MGIVLNFIHCHSSTGGWAIGWIPHQASGEIFLELSDLTSAKVDAEKLQLRHLPDEEATNLSVNDFGKHPITFLFHLLLRTYYRYHFIERTFEL
jgi:hypothetical protein